MTIRERLDRLKSTWKEDVLNISISLVLTAGISFLYKFLEISESELFIPVIFLLILIYLKTPRRRIW